MEGVLLDVFRHRDHEWAFTKDACPCCPFSFFLNRDIWHLFRWYPPGIKLNILKQKFDWYFCCAGPSRHSQNNRPLRPEAEVLLLGECLGSALGRLPYTNCMHFYGTCLSNHMQNNTPDITHTLSQVQAHILCPNSTPTCGLFRNGGPEPLIKASSCCDYGSLSFSMSVWQFFVLLITVNIGYYKKLGIKEPPVPIRFYK
jgi:hypothetical protein